MKAIAIGGLVLALSACQAFNQGDDASSAAKLEIKSDGQAIPSGPASNLLNQSVAFKVGRGIELESQRTLPGADMAVVVNKGKVYACIDQKVDNIWNCTGFTGAPSDGGIDFNMSSGSTVTSFAIAGSKLPMRSDDVLIDPDALRLYIAEIDPATREESNRLVRQLTYLKQSDLHEMKLLDNANHGETLDLSASATANTGDAQPKTDIDALKRQVITHVAIEHNFNPNDVVGFDATVEAASGSEKGYIVRGRFQVASDTPSNVYEAASARVNQNICMVAPDRCAGQKFKHTVEFEATATEFTKLDGSKGLNIEDKVAVDKPLNAPTPEQVAQQEQAGGEGKKPVSQLYICRTAEATTYTNTPGPGCEPIGGKQAAAKAQPQTKALVPAHPIPDTEPVLITSVTPRFPPQAIREHHEGTPVIDVAFDERGFPLEVKVSKSCGYRELDRAAVETGRSMRFRPGTHNGQPIAGAARFPIEFSLHRG